MIAPAKFQRAPFPYFGGKSTIADEVWSRLGRPVQYIEPFCGSAAILLAAARPASLEVINDLNFYIANFWRCIKFQPDQTWQHQDYPVSHKDLDARHRWLTDPARTAALAAALSDPEWPGDPQIAGWWVWGQCCWIGSGWCEKEISTDAGNAGRGVQSQIPHAGNAGRGVQSQIPHASDAGRGVQSQIPHASDAGRGVHDWFLTLSRRLERCRVYHCDWSRCLNHHYGGTDTAIFFDPPYKAFESLYHESSVPVADAVAEYCRAHPELRIALCGLLGDYDLPGWTIHPWTRGRLTYGGSDNTAKEAIWFSPACHANDLFSVPPIQNPKAKIKNPLCTH